MSDAKVVDNYVRLSSDVSASSRVRDIGFAPWRDAIDGSLGGRFWKVYSFQLKMSVCGFRNLLQYHELHSMQPEILIPNGYIKGERNDECKGK